MTPRVSLWGGSAAGGPAGRGNGSDFMREATLRRHPVASPGPEAALCDRRCHPAGTRRRRGRNGTGEPGFRARTRRSTRSIACATRIPSMYAVIMAGGGGTRLWPVSRSETPKPFLPLIDDRSLLRRTFDRIVGHPELGLKPDDVAVVTERRYG